MSYDIPTDYRNQCLTAMLNSPFMINTLNKLGIKWNFRDPTEGINEKPIANIIQNGKRTKAESLPPKIGKKARIYSLTIYSTLY